MLILKTLKTLERVSIIIQIIIREFVGSLLKSLNLKFNYQRLNFKSVTLTRNLRTPDDDLNDDRNMLECFQCF